jgi:transposase InsO family protein
MAAINGLMPTMFITRVRLALAALRAAIANRQPPKGCIHHSDRGSQYAAEDYRAELERLGLRGWMGRRGNPYDNARGRELHEDAQSRGGLSDGVP